ncbi:unnamed protein product, partial [Cyprideis torosa]
MGIPESELSDRLDDFENNLAKDISLAYLPSGGRVRLRLSTKDYDQNKGNERLDEQVERLRMVLGEELIVDDSDAVEVLIAKLLKQKKWSLAFAESCTGGALATRFTEHAGASAFFNGS